MLLNQPTSPSGASLPCDQMPSSPWVVYILRSTASKWVPVCRMQSRNEAWQHVDRLKKMISTASFDVVFEDQTNG